MTKKFGEILYLGQEYQDSTCFYGTFSHPTVFILFHRVNALLVMIDSRYPFGGTNNANDLKFIFLSFTVGDKSTRGVGRVGIDEIVRGN